MGGKKVNTKKKETRSRKEKKSRRSRVSKEKNIEKKREESFKEHNLKQFKNNTDLVRRSKEELKLKDVKRVDDNFTLTDLQIKARSLGIPFGGLTKDKLIKKINDYMTI